MFAVLKTGGKQYKVASGDILRVEKLAAIAGETVQFNEILMVGDRIGKPCVEDAGVQAQVIDQIKGRKVIHFVRRRRKHGSKRTKGHRQQLTLLRVTEILESGAAESGIKAAVGAGSVPQHLLLPELAATDNAVKLLTEGSASVSTEDKDGITSETEALPVPTEPEGPTTQAVSDADTETGEAEEPSETTNESEPQKGARGDDATAAVQSDDAGALDPSPEEQGETEDRDDQAK